jgi:hypothetical protein
MFSRSIPFPSLTHRGVGLRVRSLLVALTLSVASAFADAQTNKTESTLTGISIIAAEDEVAVAIDVSGQSPAFTSGVAESPPPRIYVDFRNVLPGGPRVTPSTDMRIVKVRSALHSVNPVVTRVVVELRARTPYRVVQEGNRTTIHLLASVRATNTPRLSAPPESPAPSRAPVQRSTPLAEKSAAPAAPAPSTSPAIGFRGIPPVPPLPAPRVAAPVVPPASPQPPLANPAAATTKPPFTPPPTPPISKDLEKYLRQVSGVLDRLRLQKPLLASLDGKEVQAADRLQIAAQEIERLRGELVAIKPPETLRTQHDMLIQSSTLALMATQLQLQAMGTNDTTTARNAMSAAAGALMILNRACADLLCRD